MKKLLARFLVSSSLDHGKPLSRFWRKQVSASPELEDFQRSVQEWDRQLKEPVGFGPSEVPPGLHAGIMQAVRESRREQAVEGGGWPSFRLAAGLRYGVATALLVLLALGVWLPVNRHIQGGGLRATARESVPAEVSSTLPAVAPVVEQLATNGVALLRFPMNRQMEELSQGFQQTAQFLLASLP
jgi:hypothetical protein